MKINKKSITKIVMTLLLVLPVVTHAEVSHVVFVWVKAGTSSDAITAMKEQAGVLSNIDGVNQLNVGAAVASERDTVDDSFDLGITLTFDSIVKMQNYLVHPTHVKYVSEYIKPYASKLLIYDIEHD